MRTNYKEFVILSADLDYCSGIDNRKRMRHLKGVLEDLHVNYTDCHGYYNGTSENSIMVELNHALGFSEDFFTDLACKSYDQECILHRDKYNNCYLLYSKDSIASSVYNVNKMSVGKFKQVGFDDFLNAENATEINGKYYTTVKE